MARRGGGLTFLGKARAGRGKLGRPSQAAFVSQLTRPAIFYAPSAMFGPLSCQHVCEFRHTHTQAYTRRWQHTLKPKQSDLFLSQCRSGSTFKAITCPQFA